MHSPLRQNSCGKLVSLNDVWWCRVLHYIHHKYNKEHTLSPFAGLAFHPLDGILQVCIHSFVHSFVRSFIHSFIHLFVRSFVYPSIHPTVVRAIYPFTCSVICSFIHLFICSFVCSFIHSLILLLIRSFIHVNVLSVAGCLFATQMCYSAAM